jgi:hypothetical protein
MVCVAVIAADKVQELQEHFDREPHAGNKAKILERLGVAQFGAATNADKAEDYSAVGLIFEKYRDNVRSCFDLLRKQEPDADRHGDTYRRLELQTRRGIREVEEMLIIVPGVVRPPLQIVRKDLIDIDDELIHLLFPRRTKDVEGTPPPPEEQP